MSWKETETEMFSGGARIVHLVDNEKRYLKFWQFTIAAIVLDGNDKGPDLIGDYMRFD